MTTETETTAAMHQKWFRSGDDGVLKADGLTECPLKAFDFIKQSEFIKKLSTAEFGVAFMENMKNGSAEVEERKKELFANARSLYKMNMKSTVLDGIETDVLFTEYEIDCIVEHNKSITLILQKEHSVGYQVIATVTIGMMDNTEGGKSLIILLVAVTNEMYMVENGIGYKGKGLMSFLMNVAKALHIQLDTEWRDGREDKKDVSEFHRYILVPNKATHLSLYATSHGFQVWTDPKCMVNESKEAQIRQYIHWTKCELLSASGKLLCITVISM